MATDEPRTGVATKPISAAFAVHPRVEKNDSLARSTPYQPILAVHG